MESGENRAVLSNAATSASKPSPSSGDIRGPGLFGRPNRFIQRNKLACFAAAMLSMLFVALTALLVIWFVSVVQIVSGQDADWETTFEGSGLGAGIAYALFACLLNWYFFYFVVPVAWLAISQTTGRLAHRGIAARAPYIRSMSLVGATLVGLTCTIPGWLQLTGFELSGLFTEDSAGRGVAMLIGGAITGMAVGATSGAVVGLIFVMIVRPAKQLAALQLSQADVFD